MSWEHVLDSHVLMFTNDLERLMLITLSSSSIANSLHDVDQAINVLDQLLCTIVFIMVIFIFGM